MVIHCENSFKIVLALIDALEPVARNHLEWRHMPRHHVTHSIRECSLLPLM